MMVGSQYTFLEAIYMGCILILNSKWIDNVKTPFKNNSNCFVVKDSGRLITVLKTKLSDTQHRKMISKQKQLLKKSC